MVKKIVELFYELSEKHKLVRSFKYGSLSKSAGIGDELHPHCFLENPIYFSNSDTVNGSVPTTVNFDIVVTPQMLENYSIYPSLEASQSLCYGIALNYIAKLRELINDGEVDFITSIAYWNILTLTNWFDNNADGVRVTLVLNVRNPINYCDTDEHYDEDKEFDIKQYLPQIKTDDALGCSVFGNKLQNFDI